MMLNTETDGMPCPSFGSRANPDSQCTVRAVNRRALAGGAARGLTLAAFAAWLLVAGTPCRVSADAPVSALKKYEKPVDDAIDRALAFLAKQQHEDGSLGTEEKTALTGLSVMAFLAKGYSPGLGPYGETINRGIDYVLTCQHAGGLLSGESRGNGSMYTHGIATLMLGEVSGMVDAKRQKQIDTVLPKALALILKAQSVPKSRREDNGGWRYQPTSSDADISCTSWQLMALRAARNHSAPVPTEAVQHAIEYIMNCRNDCGGFAYQTSEQNNPGLGRTGTAVLCLELLGRHRDEVTLAAGNWIRQHLPKGYGKQNMFHYAVYYCSQGMFQLGDDYWEPWATWMYDTLLPEQKPDGSWEGTEGQEQKVGPCYATAMSVLAMSVPYRQLPIYQR